MINCQDLNFSIKLSQQRIAQSKSILGSSVFNRIMCFALYNLGANRSDLSKTLDMPPGTVRSTIRAVCKGGSAAFEDRRKKTKGVVSPPLQQIEKISAHIDKQSTIIKIGNFDVKISKNNPLQTKVFLLTLLNNSMLINSEVAEILNCSKAQVSNYSKGIRHNDILCLIDKRQGQKKDYVLTESIRTELIQQFVANIVINRSTSSSYISKQVNEACNTDIADRTIRQHISKLGLNKIKHSLPEILKELKKNSKK